jgi:hypothetical protein
MVYTLRIFLFKMQCFIILTCLATVLFTFYIQGVLKFKKNNSGAESLIYVILTFLQNNFDSYLISIIYITDMLPQHPVNTMELFCECFF